MNHPYETVRYVNVGGSMHGVEMGFKPTPIKRRFIS